VAGFSGANAALGLAVPDASIEYTPAVVAGTGGKNDERAREAPATLMVAGGKSGLHRADHWGNLSGGDLGKVQQRADRRWPGLRPGSGKGETVV
jgi:hypothetical protein